MTHLARTRIFDLHSESVWEVDVAGNEIYLLDKAVVVSTMSGLYRLSNLTITDHH